MWQWDEAENASSVAPPPDSPAAPPPPPTVDLEPATALNGAAAPKRARKRRAALEPDEPTESDVALVGEAAGATAADKPRRRKKVTPSEDPV
jgi:hypothetical protein